MDAPALDRGDVPEAADDVGAVGPADVHGRVLAAVPVLGVRRGLPVVHAEGADPGRLPRRVRPLAVRGPQRRQRQARQGRVRLLEVGGEVADRVEGREVRLRLCRPRFDI